MSSEKNKFLIVVKSGIIKPQQKTISLGGQPWELEWSTSSDVPMSIDFFNLTIGKYIRKADEQKQDAKTIEEYWRVTGIPGHARKIRYGFNAPESTSTSAKPIEDGVFVVKITGMSTITNGLHAESGVGMAVFKLTQGATDSKEHIPIEATKRSPGNADNNQPVVITNEVLRTLLNLSEEGEPTKDT